MATARTALQGLLTQLVPLWSGFNPPVKFGVGWPSQLLIQDVTKGSYSLASVWDGDGTKNTTRWAGTSYIAPDVTPPTPGVTAVLSPAVLTPGGTATLTLSGAPNANDAVVFSGQPMLGASLLANAIASTGESLASLASALASSISSAALYGVTASASGAVVTISAVSTTPTLNIAANAGNVGSRTLETKRVERHVRVICWCKDEPTRQAVTDPVDSTIGYLSNYFGFPLAGTAGTSTASDWVRVRYLSDLYIEEQLADLYRRDFRVALEYGTSYLETLYPVLGGSLNFTPQVP